jgi:hypothetical protein
LIAQRNEHEQGHHAEHRARKQPSGPVRDNPPRSWQKKLTIMEADVFNIQGRPCLQDTEVCLEPMFFVNDLRFKF